MRRLCVLYLLFAFTVALAAMARGQDDESPSLGDVARQARLMKQQKDSQPGADHTSSSTTAPKNSASQSVAGTAAQNDISNRTRASAVASSETAKSAQSGKLAKKVITNEDVGATLVVPDSSPASKASSAQLQDSEQAAGKNPPEYWTNQIVAQKNSIASLKSEMDRLSASIQYAPGNCVEGCVEWNQHQQEKQQQVDSMKAQLEEMQKHLEEMQESARKQGYGSSVYDP